MYLGFWIDFSTGSFGAPGKNHRSTRMDTLLAVLPDKSGLTIIVATSHMLEARSHLQGWTAPLPPIRSSLLTAQPSCYNLAMRRVAFTISLLLLAVAAQAQTFYGKVVAVSDGDTIGVMYNGKEHKVRLHGVDSPEYKQPFGQKAKQFTSDLVFNKFVTVQVKDTDKYGRYVAVVTLEGSTQDNHERRNLNLELVKAGFAWWYQYYAKSDKDLKEAEDNARRDRLGLWADPNPVAPWEWRKANASGGGQQFALAMRL